MNERKVDQNETKFFDNDLPKDIVELLMKTHPLRKTEGFDEEKYATRYRKNLGKGEGIDDSSEAQPQRADHPIKKEVPPAGEKKAEYETTEDGIRLEIKRKRQERMQESAKKAKEEAPDERVKMIKVKSRPPKRNLSYTQADLDVARINKEADLDAFFKTDYETKKAAREEEYEEYNNPHHRGGKGSGKRRTNPKNVALFSMIAAFGIFIVFLCVTLTLSSSLAKAKEELKKYAEVEQQNSDLKLTINQMEEELNQLKASGTPTDNENEAGDKETDQTSPTPETPQTENTDTSTYTVQSGDTFWSISAKVLGNGAKYQEILDLNGMTENSPLQVGQKIKVPKK